MTTRTMLYYSAILFMTVHFSFVFCWHDYNQYYSRYHRGSSTTEPSITPISGIPSSDNVTVLEAGKSSVISEASFPIGMFLSDGLISSETDSEESKKDDEQSVFHHGDIYGDFTKGRRNYEMTTGKVVAIVMGVVISAITFICCIGICCMWICRGREHKGFVCASNIPEGQEATVVTQHFPEDPNLQQLPPPYDTQPIQYPQQFQYPPMQEKFQHLPILQERQFPALQECQFPTTSQEFQYPPTQQQQFQHPPTQQQQFQQPPTQQQQFQQPPTQQQFQQPPVNLEYHNEPSAPPPYYDK